MLDNLDFVKVIQLSMLFWRYRVLRNVLTKVILQMLYVLIFIKSATDTVVKKILLSKLDHYGILFALYLWGRVEKRTPKFFIALRLKTKKCHTSLTVQQLEQNPTLESLTLASLSYQMLCLNFVEFWQALWLQFIKDNYSSL